MTQIYYCVQSAISIYLFFGVHRFVNDDGKRYQILNPTWTPEEISNACLLWSGLVSSIIISSPVFCLTKILLSNSGFGRPYQILLSFLFNHHAKEVIYEFLRLSVISELPASSPRFLNWTERATNFQSAHCVSCQTCVDTHRVRLMDVRNLTFQPATYAESVSGRYLVRSEMKHVVAVYRILPLSGS